jgi:ATP-binding cassette, subfamily B, bacterial
VPRLSDSRDLAEEFSRAFSATNGVLNVTVNPHTRRVLVLFDASTDIGRLESVINEVLGERGGRDVAPMLHLETQALTATLAAIGAGVASLARILTLGLAIDRLLLVPAAAFGLASPPTAALLAGMVAATFAHIELKRTNDHLWHRLGRQVEYETRLAVLRRVLRSDLAILETRSVNELTASIRNNLVQLERGFDGFGELVVIAANTVLMIAAFAILMPRLLWIPLSALAFMSVTTYLGYQDAKARYDLASAARDAADSRLSEAIDALPTVKAFNLEELLFEATRRDGEIYRDRSVEASMRALRYPLRLETVTMLGVAATTVGAGLSLATGSLTPGTYMVLMMISGHMFYPFSYLGQPLESVNRALAAYRSLNAITRIPVESSTGDTPLPVSTLVPSIDLTAVSFRYPSSTTPALSGITLRLEGGTVLGIVGASGSGKSTLTKLLVRLYDPTEGEIRIDGLDIRSYSRHALRDLIAWVDQRSFLFEGSVAYNIRLGRPDADQAAIEEAARIAGIHDFIAFLPEGYATGIGVRGSKLSDGQRQRILIARGLLKQAPILVLDEPTATLDAETERIVLTGVRERMRGRTVIVIAHRLVNVRDADMIVVLDQGRIVGVGTHATLSAGNRRYRMLLEEQ